MKQTKLFRIVSLLLALVLSLCACTGTAQNDGTSPNDGTTQTPTQTSTEATLPTYEAVDNPITFFSLSLGEDYENIRQMNAYTNEDGTAYVEYVGDEKKVADLDANVFHGITAAFNASGLPELNGQDVYEEGEANGSMYVEYSDGTMVTVGFSGQVPEAFKKGFAAMDAFFLELTASVPVYVPQPVVMGEIEEDLLNAMMDILNNSGIQALDTFTVSQVAKDEYFSFALGLSSDQGISGGVSCAPMMITTAFSLVIVELEEGADAQAVCEDFENTMDWRKWVCVAPSKAMIAQKGNLVLCLMADGGLYASIAAAVQDTGWTEVKILENPDMQ